jgi:hypothetical protein
MTQNAATVARRWFQEVWNERRGESIYELMTNDAVGHSPTGETKGPDQWMSVENGKIVEGWDGWDATGLLVEVGAASLHPDFVRAKAVSG